MTVTVTCSRLVTLTDILSHVQVLLLLCLASTQCASVLITPTYEEHDEGVARSPYQEILLGLKKDSTGDDMERAEKSLLNTFPFNQKHQDHAHGREDSEHHEHHESHDHHEHSHDESDKGATRVLEGEHTEQASIIKTAGVCTFQ